MVVLDIWWERGWGKVCAFLSDLIVGGGGEHLLNKKVVLHENLLGLLKLRIYGWWNLGFWLRSPLRFALAIKDTSLLREKGRLSILRL